MQPAPPDRATTTKNATTASANFVIMGPDYDRHPSVTQHLAQALPADCGIIWVESIGIRAPRFTWQDAKRSWEKIRTWIWRRQRQAAIRLPQNFSRLNPVMIPFSQWRWARRFNRRQVQHAVAGECQRRGWQGFFLVATGPNDADLIGKLAEDASIYYIIDDFRFWPGLSPTLMAKLEESLLAKVDAVVASSDQLVALKTCRHGPTHLLTHGVDFQHFAQMPPAARNGAFFEICYFGLFDERSDQELLLSITAAIPTARITIIGQVVTNIARLTQEPRIRFVGPISYAQLPTQAAFAQAFILPYQLSELSVSINPIKIKEYLATGRPVVTLPLPEVQKFADLLLIAPDNHTFIGHLKAICDGTAPSQQTAVTRERLSQESWQAKAHKFVGYCRDAQNRRARRQARPQETL